MFISWSISKGIRLLLMILLRNVKSGWYVDKILYQAIHFMEPRNVPMRLAFYCGMDEQANYWGVIALCYWSAQTAQINILQFSVCLLYCVHNCFFKILATKKQDRPGAPIVSFHIIFERILVSLNVFVISSVIRIWRSVRFPRVPTACRD